MSMSFDDYQDEVMRTCGVAPGEFKEGLLMTSMGVGSEAGEILEHVKHHFYHAHRFDEEHMKKEIGDCLWYLAALASFCGLSLEDVIEGNVAKLQKRYPDGFSTERSINRAPDDD